MSRESKTVSNRRIPDASRVELREADEGAVTPGYDRPQTVKNPGELFLERLRQLVTGVERARFLSIILADERDRKIRLAGH